MRGKLPYIIIILHTCWITPADAGKTQTGLEASALLRDHPRGCGENYSGMYARVSINGSPPRMRGKLDRSTQNRVCQRITPADAGKTRRGIQSNADSTDHPRGCGENISEILFEPESKGSPPRMRGKH